MIYCLAGAACLQLLLASSVGSFSFQFPRHVRVQQWQQRPTMTANQRQRLTTVHGMADNLLESFAALFPNWNVVDEPSPPSNNGNVAVSFLEALNQGNVDAALALFEADGCEWDDCSFYQRCVGKAAIERRLRLAAETTAAQSQLYRVDQVAVDTTRQTIGVLFHKEDLEGTAVSNSRGCAMFRMDANMAWISAVVVVGEPATRGGEQGLKILSKASEVMKRTGYNPETIQQQQQFTRNKKSPDLRGGSLTPPERYFDAWNRRDMTAAVDVFSEDTKYEDTAFPAPFVGKEVLKKHLFKCADAFPASFQIIIDAVAVDSASKSAAVEWHFEDGEGVALPFTQGCSFYKLDNGMQKIVEGIDFIEPAVIKPSGLFLLVDSLKNNLSREPLRWIAVLSWVAYMYIVFFSDGILPGANALQLEVRTWEEVLNLSLNFFLVAPLLNLPFSPSVHPMLEGVFNLLLSWAAMFAGFLSDDRPRKPNIVPMLPIVVGMQFLTSAFLLPYLALRSSEREETFVVTKEDLPLAARLAGESPVLGGLMGLVGSGSIGWFFLGRAEEYGTEFLVRLGSFVDLLSIDRVGSSFLVDLAIFALFQGWLVDDDLKRRGALGEAIVLEAVAKYIPFFGLAAYLIWRPRLPEANSEMPEL